MSYSHSCDFFQMTFLRLLSKEAHQNMTYTCINSVAWYDNQARNYDKSVRLMGSNDDEFSAIQNKPNVENDGCKFGGRESKTVFNIVTKKRDQVCSLTQNRIDFIFQTCLSQRFMAQVLLARKIHLKLLSYISSKTIPKLIALNELELVSMP